MSSDVRNILHFEINNSKLYKKIFFLKSNQIKHIFSHDTKQKVLKAFWSMKVCLRSTNLVNSQKH